MNEFNKSLLLVLIASAVSTYSYGMLPGDEDMKQAEAFAKEQEAKAARTAEAQVHSAPAATSEGSASPLAQVLPGEVRPEAPLSPRKKSELETTVYKDSSTAAPASESRTSSPKPAVHPDFHPLITTGERDKLGIDSAGHVIPGSEKTATLPIVTSEGTASPTPSSPRESDDGGYVSASDGRSREGSRIKEPAPARPGEVEAGKKIDSALAREHSATPPVEESMVRKHDDNKAAGVGLPPASSRSTITFAEKDLKKCTSGSGQARHEDGTEAIEKATALETGERSADRTASPGVCAGAAPDLGEKDVAAGSAAAQKDSLLEKIKRNKLKTFAIILALAEAADLTQAFFLKTTKEELKDKTLVQKAKLVAQKTYTAKLIGAAKDGLMNRVVPGILDLKQKAQNYINKKTQTT